MAAIRIETSIDRINRIAWLFILSILLIDVRQESKGRHGWQMWVAERERLQASILFFGLWNVDCVFGAQSVVQPPINNSSSFPSCSFVVLRAPSWISFFPVCCSEARPRWLFKMTLGRKSSLFGSLALAAMLLWGHRPLCAFNSSQIRILTNRPGRDLSHPGPLQPAGGSVQSLL